MRKANEETIEELRADTIREYHKVCDKKDELRIRVKQLEKDIRVTMGLNPGGNETLTKASYSVSVDKAGDTQIEKSVQLLREERKHCLNIIELDDYNFTEYRRALIKYLEALEPVFDEIWEPMVKEIEAYEREKRAMQEREDQLYNLKRDINCDLYEILSDVGATAFSDNRSSYQGRNVVLGKLRRLEKNLHEA